MAKLLSRENQDIIVVDRDHEKLDKLDANYNLMTYVGSPTSFRDLAAAGVNADCDLLIAVTPFENTNLVACAIGKRLGATKTVARIDNYEFLSGTGREFQLDRGRPSDLSGGPCRPGDSHRVAPPMGQELV